ncbi:hypothetical protein TNCT_118751 [Trichonephila clavata]|uniref:Uncharacterized protein n=1 Tax=Trichonephila clavata TaxID=2740835 RepID=A0A8X6G2N9_TRICU|nr:hypothetical protein TNCT_118751 [Trichonephila clavata]
MNAADIASRGCNAQTLFSLCWWEGPIWLKNRSSWPDTKDSDFKDALELATEERKPTVTTNLSLNDSDSNFFEWTKRVSKFSSIVRTLAYVKRFLSNAKSVANRQKDSLLKGNLSEKELSKSELEILLFIQKETFGKIVDSYHRTLSFTLILMASSEWRQNFSLQILEITLDDLFYYLTNMNLF